MMLRQIQHFQTVIQENSFTEAAELCHISQSGISRSIQLLQFNEQLTMNNVQWRWVYENTYHYYSCIGCFGGLVFSSVKHL